MQTNLEDRYLIFSLLDLIEEETIGEEKVKCILSNFSCKNKDVQYFLQKKAIEFAKDGITSTFLIFIEKEDKMQLVAYFSLANKQFIVEKKALSRKMKERISHLTGQKLSSQAKEFYIAAPLIAQLGKNFTNNADKLISGDDLMALALKKIDDVHRILSGRMCFVECEDIDYLLKYYRRYDFVEFNRRELDAEEKSKSKAKFYIQMLRCPSRKKNNKSKE